MLAKPLALSLVMLVLTWAWAFSETFLSSSEFFELEPGAQDAIIRVVYDEALADFLEQYPQWTAYAYAETETQWHIDFYDEGSWVGNVFLDTANNEIYDSYLVKDLSPEAFQTGKAKIEKLVFRDAEVLALLGDKDEWTYDISYNKWEQRWQMTFWRTIEALAIDFDEYDERFYIARMYDPYAFSAEEQEELERNKAIELAYAAEGIYEALEGLDAWHTYAEPIAEGIWGVEFSGGQRFFYAVVDLAKEAVIEISSR